MASVRMEAVAGRCLRSCAVACLAVVLSAASLAALPAKGAPASSIESLKLLQAPSGAKASWASLRGKVVVLEFWATWCSPCVAALPHFNQLVASLDPAKFQFISIDDEDLHTVENFLRKKQIAGWVGIDNGGAVIKSYGVTTRPTTVIIDRTGRIAAVTSSDELTAAKLQAIAAGKSAAFKPAGEVLHAVASTDSAVAQSLFAVSITRSAPGAKPSTTEHPPTGIDFRAASSDGLFTSVFEIFTQRYALQGSMPDGLYDLHMNYGNASEREARPIVQQALLAALGLQITPRTLTGRALLLHAIDDDHKRLSPSASAHATKRGSWHGIFILMNGSMDDLAYILGTALETPVVNETGIEGAYDVRFKLPGDQIEHVTAANINTILRSTLGLELVESERQLPISVLEVSKKPEPQPVVKTQGAAAQK